MEKFNLFKKACQSKDIHFLQTKLEDYASDYSKLPKQNPQLVCLPKSSEEIAFLLQEANKHGISITTRGLGSGKSGGAIPSKNSVVLSLEKMNTILDVDVDNRVIVLEPGVKTLAIHQCVEEKGLFYPPDPASLDICSIGGNVAENAGGARALKYGVTRNYVLGLKGFFGDGRAFSFGGKVHKNVAGYDMLGLLVGSEGTLAVITEITLKLIAKPKLSYLVLVSSDTHKQSLDVLLGIQKLGIQPACCELFDDFCYDAAKNYIKNDVPDATGKSFLLIELDGFEKESLLAQLNAIKKTSERLGLRFFFEEKSHNQKAWWTLRRSLSEALSSRCLKKRSEDIVVPLSKMPFFLDFLKSLSNDTLHILGYGHAGDGNIHVNLLLLKDVENWEGLVYRFIKTILEKVVEIGGTITGEHGIGLSKKDFLPLMFDEEQIKQFKALKTLCDPKHILNPDKIF